MDRKVIVMRKDGIIHWSALNISVAVSLFFYQNLMLIPPFYPNDKLPLIKEGLLLR